MEHVMKMLPRHYEVLKQCLISDTAVEQGCFALCTVSRGKQRTSLLINEIIPLTGKDFVVQEELQLSVSPQTMLRVARKAQSGSYAICMIHTHPMCDGYVEFSEADDFGNLRTFPFFHRMLPGMLHSCLVWDKNLKHVSGRIYGDQNSWHRINNVEVIGIPSVIDMTGDNQLREPDKEDSKYVRQALLLGKKGQKLIRKRRIGIIGYGGLGASVSMIAVHTGFKPITGVDPDIVERSNLPRIPASTEQDVVEEWLKVLIGQRYAEYIDSEIEFIYLPCPVEDPSIAPNLKDCDALVATTDTTRSRAFLNQFCQQHYLLLLDIGVEFVSDKEGNIKNDIGKVNLVLPGTACLQCSMHIDPDRLRAESLPENQRKKEIREGYIRGIDIEQPSMMMFNMQVAARGIQRLVGYFTGLLPVDTKVYECFSFLELSGRKYHKMVKKVVDSDCPFCKENSLYLGKGDSLSMLITSLTREKEVLNTETQA